MLAIEEREDIVLRRRDAAWLNRFGPKPGRDHRTFRTQTILYHCMGRPSNDGRERPPPPLQGAAGRWHNAAGRVLRLALAAALVAGIWRTLVGSGGDWTPLGPPHGSSYSKEALEGTEGAAAYDGAPTRRPRVAIFNDVSWHHEVYAAHTFILSSIAPRPYVDLYTLPGWDQGISEVMRSWHPLPAKPAADFWPAACSYKFVLIVTAPFDQYHPPINETAAAHWLSCPDGGQRPIIAVMVHIADHFSKPLAARQLAWLRPSYVLGTAPHTADVMRSFGPGKVDYLSSLYPLFPEGWNSTSRRGLGIGGQLDTTRRDYASVFRELETSPPPAGSPALPVRLLGSFGPPHANATIPPALLQNGLVDLPGGGRRVPYGEFFKHFPLARALLPAFKTGAGYTVHTASSVLFNSLVSLTPLAVPAEVLALYSFLDPRAHFNPEDGTVLAAHKAMVGKEGEYGGMLSRLLENRECLMRRNVEVAEAMLRGGEVGLPNECGKGR